MNKLPHGFIVLCSFAITLWLLWWLKPILIAVAFAIFLSFLLSPVVAVIERPNIPRTAAVGVVMLLMACLVATFSWLIIRQTDGLLDTFEQYEQNLNSKLAAFEGLGSGPLKKLDQMLRRGVGRLGSQVDNPSAAGGAAATPVRIIDDTSPFKAAHLWAAFSTTLAPFATLGLTVVLVVFMLIRREDLRDRFIQLIGHRWLTTTTRALDEAGARVSRYLLLQFITNSAFGGAIGLGLFLIGVPHALLWGFLAGVLRYIPYVGAWFAALLPMCLSLVVFDQWWPALAVVGLFLTLDFITNVLIEPTVYGQGIGVSETATLVMVAFWTWLWGPIGLILATPITACVVVIGRYVPALEFFSVLLGNRPAMGAQATLYQRLVARDQDEAMDIAMREAEGDGDSTKVYDELLLPSLFQLKQDLHKEYLDAAHAESILATMRQIADAVETNADRTSETTAEPDALGHSARMRLLLCPARDACDEASLGLVGNTLDARRYEVCHTTTAMLANEVVQLVDELKPSVVCIAAIPPGGRGPASLLCRRLRASHPDVRIIVCRWGTVSDKAVDDLLCAAGADAVHTTIREVLERIESYRALTSAESMPAA